MIHRFHCLDFLGYDGHLFIQMFYEGRFLDSGADDQNMSGFLQCIGDIVEIARIVRLIAVAVFQVRMGMHGMGFESLGIGAIQVEVDDLRFGMIEPHDCVMK